VKARTKPGVGLVESAITEAHSMLINEEEDEDKTAVGILYGDDSDDEELTAAEKALEDIKDKVKTRTEKFLLKLERDLGVHMRRRRGIEDIEDISDEV